MHEKKSTKRWWALELFFYLLTLSLMLVLHLDVFTDKIVFEVPPCDPTVSFTRKEDSISLELVLLLCIIVPIIIIFLLELLEVGNHESPLLSPTARVLKRMKEGACRSVCPVWSLLVGGLFASFLVEVTKLLTAVPRPYFWHACGGRCTDYQTGESMTLQNCSKFEEDPREIVDAIKSFPSGHACVAVFSTVFIACYFQARFAPFRGGQFQYSSLLRKWLTLLWVVFAFVASYSRVKDHVHHWGDIVGGALYGAAVGIYVVYIVSDNFASIKKYRKKKDFRHKEDCLESGQPMN